MPIVVVVVVPFGVSDGFVVVCDVDADADAARTVDTSDEARALGVAGDDGDDGPGSWRVCDAFRE